MLASIAIDIAAPPELVFRLARDVERWPSLLPHYLRVRVQARHPDGALTAQMVAIRRVVPAIGLGIPVAWRARTWSDESTRSLRFRHLGGATAGMGVTWRIEPTAAGCHVTIEHDFARAPVAWAALIDRLFVRPIAARTLATFKAIAEAVVERSDPSAPPKNQA
ncbi:MAG TPA: SRPBCC family protein [Candidatus Limnocylindrales bacterium]|nr:SRPBCC family protein [Candidatus Limnocylindrales bacterium]